jgi:hypothetical protein
MGQMKNLLQIQIELIAWNLADVRGTWERQPAYEARLWATWQRRPEKIRWLVMNVCRGVK